jgi:PII-like signaling protein
MDTTREAFLLRIFIAESDHYGGRPLFEALVHKARELNLAGATVLRGPLGFGASHVLHNQKILRLADNLPVVLEIVDSREKLDTFWAAARPMVSSGLATLEKVTVLSVSKESGSS